MVHFRKIDTISKNVFDTVLEKVKGQFETRALDHDAGLKLISGFDELQKYNSLFVHMVTEFKGASGSFIIMLVEMQLTIFVHSRRKYAPRPKEIEEVEPVLIFNLKHDIGRALIKQESLADKFADLFTKVDVDFEEYPAFSKNYFAVAEKPDLFRANFPVGLLDALGSIRHMTIEINGHWGLLRRGMNLTEDLLLQLISIGQKR